MKKLKKAIKQMGKKKISEKDLVDIKKLQELIDQHLLTADALKGVLQNFLGSKMSKYGLDAQKRWNFDTENGVIVEVKQPLPNPAMAPPTPPAPPKVPPVKMPVK